MTRTTCSVAALFAAFTLAGCGGAPAPAAGPESASSASAPQKDGVPPPASAGSGESAAAASADAPAGAAPADPEPAPAKRPVSVDIVVGGKHAGDSSIERVVSGVKPGLETCYRAGLEGTPTAGGAVDFQIHVTDSGAIKKVESTNPNTMPGSVTTCMVGRFGALSFEPKPKTKIEVKVTCRPGG